MPPMSNRLGELLSENDFLYCVICRDVTLTDIELMAQEGYHLVWIDLEHSAQSMEEAIQLGRSITHLGMVSVVRIEPNAVGAIHSHPQEQWGLMLEGSAVRIQDGEEIEVKKGDFWVSPGGIEHGVIGGPDGAVILDVFSPPREEYTSPGSGFGTE